MPAAYHDRPFELLMLCVADMPVPMLLRAVGRSNARVREALGVAESYTERITRQP